jgi:putative transposase
MSRTGECWGNSVAESFFATIKAELIDDERFATCAGAGAAIADYIERLLQHTRGTRLSATSAHRILRSQISARAAL